MDQSLLSKTYGMGYCIKGFTNVKVITSVCEGLLIMQSKKISICCEVEQLLNLEGEIDLLV